MDYFCNPINVDYRYQFTADPRMGDEVLVYREAADPSMICFEGRYYIFASMTLGVWVSDDLVHWENHRLPDELPLYDYAPDVRVLNGYVYLCASQRGKPCDRWRTKDVLNGPYEKVPGTFDYWDPNLFIDDDGRVYFYWGCSNHAPLYGIELDPETMKPVGQRAELIAGDPFHHGYERCGEDNSFPPADDATVTERVRIDLESRGERLEDYTPEQLELMKHLFNGMPYIEGIWMDKHCGRYYLQYASPGAHQNVYCDGVYTSTSPLGPFTLAENSPFSYKPGGFINAAGHGSTMQDLQGSWWHTATMRISVNHNFERRVGLWAAGFDADGELFCNQRYGDWPMRVSTLRQDPWRNPEWMLLSAGKSAAASSYVPGCEPEKAAEEDIRTWWQAKTADRNEWLCLDLGQVFDVRAVQINFADDHPTPPLPGALRPGFQDRYIDDAPHKTQWLLEGSADGETWFVIEDKSQADTDLTHDLVVREGGFAARFLRLSRMAVAYGVPPCVSGLRVFGLGKGAAPAVPLFKAVRTTPLDMEVSIEPQPDTVGWNILFGASPEKLYHSYMVFSPETKRIGALVDGRDYYVRVDAFNENGITEGVWARL